MPNFPDQADKKDGFYRDAGQELYENTTGAKCLIVFCSVSTSAVKRSIGSTTGCTITEKAPTRTRPSLMTFASVSQFYVYLPWVNACLA